MSATSAIEGAVSVRLRVSGGAVRRAEVAVRRPTAAARALVGRRPEEAARLVPLLFSLCGTAQGLAAALACEAALGIDAPASGHPAARSLMLDAEAADNHAWQIAMEWPKLLGEPPDPQSLRALRAAVAALGNTLHPAGDGLMPGGGSLRPDPAALGLAVDGIAGWIGSRVFAGPCPADLDSLAVWAARGATAAARLTARLLAPGLAPQGAVGVAALDEDRPSWFGERLAADPAFSSRPHRDGAPAHTGPLARRAGHPLVASVAARHGFGLAALAAARLADLAELPARMAGTLARVAPAAPLALGPARAGAGCGVVETARGRLAHWLRLGPDGRIADFRTVAPTEWNFAADGPLARGLAGLPDGPDLPERARLLAALLDPCVACAISIVGEDGGGADGGAGG
ncbi:nickel-dependent hydrogenase large subunit [Azospirillum agricola]|uniref:nickel-dependent hydrogenase large subunit n=1 Tax=Azospirillum agricola TaxID=1720247 RepID=UPI000A0F3647|nr:nickel-dependent hydrogenase large subunit [Azospirillum agricola]SMH34196.1 Coenzyme F420-reducing hydrogenase, alpha subunit [Azospirillum lipoferum]